MATPDRPYRLPPGTIIPARGVVVKGDTTHSRKPPSDPPIAPLDDPPIVPICPCFDSMFDGLGDGVPVRYDGNWVFMNDMPTTGGPWALAFTNTGQPCWVNLAGL